MRGWILTGVMIMSSVVAAFDPPIAKVGDLTVHIDAPQIITQLETQIPVRVHLSNAGVQTLRGKARLQLVDRWKVVSANPQPFELPPKSERTLEFAVIAGKGTHNAHYPIHAFAEWVAGQGAKNEQKAHAVLIVEVRAPREPKRPKETIVKLSERGSVPLWQQGNQQVSFQIFVQPVQTMPQGWWGTDEATGAHAVLQRVDRGGTKEAVAVHPPWRKGAGTIFLDWQVSLPRTKPIFLDFAFAIRDHDPQREPPSDGVTVRVWVKRQDKETGRKASEKTRQELSKVISNPTQLRQVGKFLPLQEPEQFFVRSPKSCPDFLRDDQINCVVVTDAPTQSSVENLLSVPINTATVDGHFCQDFLKEKEGLSSDWSSLSQCFHQSPQNFVLKSVRDMGVYFIAQNICNQSSSGQTDFWWLIQKYNCQDHESVYDDDFLVFGLLFHPLANSLCLRKLLKMPLPLTPNWERSLAMNSSREIFPSLSFCTILRNFSTTSRSLTANGSLFRLATIFHLTPQFCRSNFAQTTPNRHKQLIAFDGGGAPTHDGDDGWQLLYEHHSDSKIWVPARVDLSQFAGQRITLRLEVHPGPKNDTTCDLAFIGEPYLVAGRTPTVERIEAKTDERLQLLARVRW
ncbi:MAG: hypothetical protein ACK40X_02270, partial [Armatimonadota bacterium]